MSLPDKIEEVLVTNIYPHQLETLSVGEVMVICKDLQQAKAAILSAIEDSLPVPAVYEPDGRKSRKDGRTYATKDFVMGQEDMLLEVKKILGGEL